MKIKHRFFIPIFRNIFWVIWFVVGGTVFIFPNHLNAASVNAFKPTWAIGQTWEVDVEKAKEARAKPRDKNDAFEPPTGTNIFTYRFLVEKIISIDEERCYQIKIECTSVDENAVNDIYCYYIYFRYGDKTLKKVQRFSKINNRVEAETEFEPGFVDATDWVGFLPLDFPDFNVDFEESSNNEKSFHLATKKDRDAVYFTKNRKALEGKGVVSLKVRFDHTDKKNKVSRQSIQEWSQGRPWWNASIYLKDGKTFLFGKLKTVNNQKLDIKTSKSELLE